MDSERVDDFVVKVFDDEGGFIYKTDMTPLGECLFKRKSEYPPMADYLDGIVKGDQAQIDAYIAACQAVKAKYPKPE